MAGRGSSRARRIAGIGGVVLALVAAGLGTAVATDRDDDVLEAVFGPRPGEPVTADPAAIEPPETLDLPALDGLADPSPAAETLPMRGDLDESAIRDALAGLGDEDLGNRVLSAVGVAGRPATYRAGPSVAIPASTTKIVTSAAALLALDPGTRFTTRVASAGPGRIVLVGGGDPFLAAVPTSADPDAPSYPERADLTTLAKRTAATLRRQNRSRVEVYFDDRLFGGPAVSPRWRADYVPDEVVAPIGSLMADGGRPVTGSGRVENPPATAAAVFSAALAERGIRVVGVPQDAALAGVDPADRSLAQVTSAPLDQIVERVLDVSDNEASEVLLRHVGLATSGDGSFAGGQRGVEEALAEIGVELGSDEVLWDGSGLSRQNRLSPETLLGVLGAAATTEGSRLDAVIAGLPVAGFTGSLTNRFSEGAPAARGRVRAKTGTLTNVFSLAGVAVTDTGTVMVFAFMADRIRKEDTAKALIAMDNAASRLGSCACGS